MTQFSRLLSITVGLLLLAGCLTVGTLLFIRTEARRRRIRNPRGARRESRESRSRCRGGSALLSVAGAALSLPFTSWFVALLASLQLPGGINVDALGLSIDRAVWISSVSISLVAMIAITFVAGVFGVSSRVSPQTRVPGRHHA